MQQNLESHRGQFIRTLGEGVRVTEHYRVLRKSIKTTRHGDPYLDLDLGDRTGSITARLFGSRSSVDDPVTSYASLFEVGDAVRVAGRVDVFRGRLQLILDRVRPSLPGEVDETLLEKSSGRPLQEMEEELHESIRSIGNESLRSLAEQVFGDREFYARFLVAPAATRLHHAYRHGLLEHTLTLLQAAEALRPVYAELDWDLARVGILFHDIGKTEELGKRAGEDYTIPGTLEGHIYLGTRRVEREIDQMEDFPAELKVQVLHLILSHHGEREFGSPIEPATIEAVFLHQLDNLDAKLANAREVLDADRNPDAPFTDRSAAGAISRRYYKGPPPARSKGDEKA